MEQEWMGIHSKIARWDLWNGGRVGNFERIGRELVLHGELVVFREVVA